MIDLWAAAGWWLAALMTGYAAGNRVAFREQMAMFQVVVRAGVHEVVESLRPPPGNEPPVFRNVLGGVPPPPPRKR